MRKEYEKLELFNYSPVPFLDLHKRQFLPIRRLQNSGDLYDDQWVRHQASATDSAIAYRSRLNISTKGIGSPACSKGEAE